MWVSVCGSTGRLTSGLHYKRKALWGSDPSSAYKGAVVAQARNKLYKTSGERTRRELKNKNCVGLFMCTLFIMRVHAVLTHSLFDVVPKFCLNEVLAVFRQNQSQAARKRQSHS